ncbi:MAG: CopG family transcriptional regulator [Gemmatimonadota bacterium]
MSHRLQVLIPESLSARLQKAADRSRLSRSAWVRRVIERALEEEHAVRDPLTTLAGLGAPTGDIDQVLAEIESGRG